MTDATEAFFDAVRRHGHEPSLEYVSGSIAFDIADGKTRRRWRVDVRKGDITVSRKASAADCIVRADKTVFERIVTGRSNPMTAMLRGEVAFEGDPRLLVLFRRLQPAPAAAAGTGGRR